MAVEILRNDLATKLNTKQLAKFKDADLELLIAARYEDLSALEPAREEELIATRLPVALIGILRHAGVFGPVAGPGPGSMGVGVLLQLCSFMTQHRGEAQLHPGDVYLLTAFDAIMRAPPCIEERISPRSSGSTTVPRACTFSAVALWPEFDELLAHGRAQLDRTKRSFVPVLRAGKAGASEGFRAPADECEVRAPMQNMAELVNAVAASVGIQAAFSGGGSGRSSSATDYIVQKQRGDQEQQQEQRGGQRQPRIVLSRDVLACIAIKGHWQFPLDLSHDVASMSLEQLKSARLIAALQQCFGDMVMDEAPLGMVTRHNVALLLKRSSDVKDTTLYVSPPIGLDLMLLAMLTLLQQAQQLEGLKQELRRDEVPNTPPQGYVQPELQRRRSPRLQEQQQVQQQQVSCCDAVGGQGLGDEGSRSSGSSAGASSGGGDASSSGMSTIGTIDVSLQGQGPEGLEWLPGDCGGKALHLELYGFGDVGLTGRCAGSGRYGNVLEGDIDGVAVVVKLFEQRRRGAVDAFARELAVYSHLRNSGSGLQGVAVPRLLRFGMFAHTGALFLAVTDEGDDLEAGAGGSDDDLEADAGGADSSGGGGTFAGGSAGDGGSSGGGSGGGAVITQELRAMMVAALRALHSAGVLHGDIRLSNFVLVDLGEAKVVGVSEVGSSHQAAMEAEVRSVQVL
ncbi:hypothetical protein TSOC_002304 [Tetrabaena socialis]|uniref:Protein kinase domain-containing protein n=1 Tax=Tetrabaena socialis TaxID=47790 RepID=A0A2J8AEK0_9CHLO|nr:hypothetical protein TSOC_002304 [Tetrabaena socialis]|eukprot:PNH10926.1 hypothetical protein TSOC_002304 [Tetrabaena socialis]